MHRAEVMEADEGANDVGMTVLVDAPELVQNGELVPVRGALPTTKRLQSLKVCQQARVNQSEGIPAPGRPIGLIENDWEAGLPPRPPRDWIGWRRAAIEIAEVPNEMVEGAAKVVDGVPDHAAEADPWAAGWCRVEREFPWIHIHVSLDLYGVRVVVDEGAKSPFERTYVFVRSTDPFETAYQVGHGR